MKYAGFLSRAIAATVDGLVLLPFGFLFLWVVSFKGAALLLAVPLAAVGPAYQIWLHARSGQTLGKRFAGIRVLRLDGERISWREALSRSSVDAGFCVAETVVTLLALYQLSDAQLSVSWFERSELFMQHGPVWGKYVSYASAAWGASELVSLLFNAKRRALHDFIAGTIVVHESLEATSREQPFLGSARAPSVSVKS